MTVVAAYTPGARGAAVLDAAIAEAERRHSDALVVNVSPGNALTDRAALSREDVAALSEQAHGHGVALEVRLVDAADPVEAVLDVVGTVAASVVVLGVRRRSQVGKMILGSTAQRLLLDLPCPVLAVKA